MIKLRYGNTNTFFIPGAGGGLLVDTDWAGTLPQFFKAIKAAGIEMKTITTLLITHYHPDHMGLAGELKQLTYRPVDEHAATLISCSESRALLKAHGIGGEILHTPSHSQDSVSLLLDDGSCLVGDLEPLAYLAGYDENPALKNDWEQILRRHPKRILYAHANEQSL